MKRTAKKTDSDRVELSMNLSFLPSEIGEERTALIWKGVAMMIAGIAEEDEKDQLMDQMANYKGGGLKWSSHKVKSRTRDQIRGDVK